MTWFFDSIKALHQFLVQGISYVSYFLEFSTIWQTMSAH